MIQIKVPFPKDKTEGTAKVSGEAQTYFRTKFNWVVCFSNKAIELLETPPEPKLHPIIKPLKLSISRRYKALYAKVGPEKIDFIAEKPKEKDKFLVEVHNTDPELEQMIWDVEHM